MMTYGWAILIIVIVAVILYSMGIFNPSSSVTFTSSGFSPFTVSSSLCNNLGYKIAIIAGPIPDNANSLQIDKVFLTSATGANTTTASYALTNPVSLKSGQTATILVPNVACTAAGIHYSLSASIQYSYSTTAGNVVQNTTGTVAGTSIAGKPAVLTSYEPLTITNSQSSATPSPFQQMINFTSSDSGWTSISTGNFGQNVEFFYYNGTVIPSWLENYTVDNATWWLKIAAIPAGSSETVYVGFASSTTNLFNTVNDGEAPQLTCSNPSDTASCSTYAKYDDGADVFNFYDNFAGTSLNTNKWSVSSGLTYSVDNGISLTGSSQCGSGLESTITFSSPIIVEGYGSMGSDTSTSAGCYISGIGIWYTSGGQITNGWATDNVQKFGINGWTGSSAFWSSEDNPQPTVGNNYVWGLGYINSSTAVGYINYKQVSSTSTAIRTSGSLTTIIDLQDSNVFNINLTWYNVRAYPPNGVMPNVYFGEVS